MAKHGPALTTYFVIFAALLVGTALTIAVAYADLGAWATPIAVAIACAKATLVVLYFMHVRYETRLVAMWAASGFLFLLIMLALTFGEVMGRGKVPPDPLVAPGALR